METANFFRQIAQMDINSKLMLTIAKATESTIIVSILIENENCSDKAKNIIPPFNLTGTPEELDNEFIQRIKKPMQTADSLISNMESFMLQLEHAKASSAMEKGKNDKHKKEGDSKIRKYSEAMLKADAFEAEGKFKEAWSALPKVNDFPEHAEAIRNKKEIYEREFAPSLFNNTQETEEQEIQE